MIKHNLVLDTEVVLSTMPTTRLQMRITGPSDKGAGSAQYGFIDATQEKFRSQPSIAGWYVAVTVYISHILPQS